MWNNALDFIRAEDPDILLMQEVFNDHNPKVEQRFRTIDEYMKLGMFSDYDFAPAMLFVAEHGKVEQGNAIFSKLPLTKRYEPVFFNEPFNDNYVDVAPYFETVARNLQHVTLEANGKPLDIFNFQGVWDLDGDNDSPKRQRMCNIILENVHNLEHVVLGGDTNARPTNPSMQKVAAELKNVFAGELSTTFNLKQKDLEKYPGYADSVVDMLFVSPDMRVIEHSCPEIDASDHLPLVMTIEL